MTLIDDIDGATAAETIGFSLDSKHYEIDLSARNAAMLRKLLAPYAEAGRRLTPPAAWSRPSLSSGAHRG